MTAEGLVQGAGMDSHLLADAADAERLVKMGQHVFDGGIGSGLAVDLVAADGRVEGPWLPGQHFQNQCQNHVLQFRHHQRRLPRVGFSEKDLHDERCQTMQSMPRLGGHYQFLSVWHEECRSIRISLVGVGTQRLWLADQTEKVGLILLLAEIHNHWCPLARQKATGSLGEVHTCTTVVKSLTEWNVQVVGMGIGCGANREAGCGSDVDQMQRGQLNRMNRKSIAWRGFKFERLYEA